MGKIQNDPSSETGHLVEWLRAGDHCALAEMFQHYLDRLRRMVDLRMDVRLHGRVDASDVLQDGFIDLAKRVESYLSDPKLPGFSGCDWSSAIGWRFTAGIIWGLHCGTLVGSFALS